VKPESLLLAGIISMVIHVVYIEIIGYEGEEEFDEAKRVVVEAVNRLSLEDVLIMEYSPDSFEATSKYGILLSPTICIDGTAMFIGRVPSLSEVIDALIRSTMMPYV